MKKVFLSMLLILALSLSFFHIASAEDVFGLEYRVDKCREYITLREEPRTSAGEITRVPLGATVTAFTEAENGFMYVNYMGKTGYVLSRYLTQIPPVYGREITLTESQRKDLNLFLSNFTESSLCYYAGGVFDIQNASDGMLVEFALDHIWFNYHESRVEWGEYMNDNNVRVHKKYVPEITEKYFGVVPLSPDPLYVDYTDPYYYWMETGGHVSDGFASLKSASYLGGDRYLVSFTILAGGEMWDNSDTALTYEKALAKFPDYARQGFAIIYTPNLSDRASYKLTRLVTG